MRVDILDRILKERERQDILFGPNGGMDSDPLTLKLTVLAEEFGEVAHAILEHDDENMEEELVQVAAVCVAWLETIPA